MITKFNKFLNEDKVNIKNMMNPKTKEEILKNLENSNMLSGSHIDSILMKDYWTDEEKVKLLKKLDISNLCGLEEPEYKEHNIKINDLFTNKEIKEIIKRSKSQLNVLINNQYEYHHFIDLFTDKEIKEIAKLNSSDLLRILFLPIDDFRIGNDTEKLEYIKSLFTDKEVEELKKTIPAKEQLQFIFWFHAEKIYTDKEFRELFIDLCGSENVTYGKVSRLLGFDLSTLEKIIKKLFKTNDN